MAKTILMTRLRKNIICFFIIALLTALISSPGFAQAADEQPGAQKEKPQLPKNISTVNPETLRLIEIIEKKNKDLQRREAELLAREENLKTLEKKIREDLRKIEAAMVRSEELAGAKKGMIEKNINALTKVYSSMKPAQAAAVLEKVDEAIALQIIARMKSKVAGKILGKMNKSAAISISERLAGKFAKEEAAASN